MSTSRTTAALLLAVSSLALTPAIYAQSDSDDGEPIEEIIAVGIRGSLANAVDQKRNSTSVVEVIVAEDIGKLPDQNLAEVLENITGIQITREAGVGTGVQIRGTNANRTEINGVSTVGSGDGRSGIDFEDVAASLIAGVEVAKTSEAKTIEGSVGGTINLRTIRPLALTEALGSIRVQGEQSDLSAEDDITPRLSGAWGNNWAAGAGEFGVVFSASYAESDVSAFRPRADRDNLSSITSNVNSTAGFDNVPFDFLPIQFLNQDYDNFEYETKNLAGSLEWAPNDELTFLFDVVLNDQERRQEGYRVQVSGVGGSGVIGPAQYDGFETIDFGSLDSAIGIQDIGTIQAATQGVLFPQQTGNLDPNMRTSTDTGSRVTDSKLFRLGGEWARDRFVVSAELSSSSSDTSSPGITSTLNFLNPNSAISAGRNDNGVPIQFDLTGGQLAFGIAQGLATTPTVQMLLDPANYVLQQFNQSEDRAENSEDAFRVDVTYDLDWSGITSVDVGYRYNESSSLSDTVGINYSIGGALANTPTGDLFSSALAVGPNNYNDGDSRSLFIQDFLYLNPTMAFNDVAGMVDALNAAIAANNTANGTSTPPISSPTSTAASFFDIEEKTHALYAQANFEYGIFRGNFGARYLETDVNSLGNSIVNGVPEPTVTKGKYDFVLPRINVAADLSEDWVLRFGWGKDIRRPDFSDLSTSATFESSENASVSIGNPDLKPEEVDSIDLSVEWYFAPGSLLSAGYFYKTRTDLHVGQTDSAAVDSNNYRDRTPPCEGGGVYNPIAVRNTYAPPSENGLLGMCVDASTTLNGAGDTTQEGFELAFQYDLAEFEDKLGWASGFGFIANYTHQKFTGGDTFQQPSTRADQVFTSLGFPDASLRATLLDLSEDAYNITMYYEKYGVSSRLRYTWRDAYRTNDYASSGAALWGFEHVQEDRAQLNASINYAVTDDLNIGLEAINLTSEDAPTSCVNEGALLCFQGITDRRIIFGGSYRF